MKYSIVVPIYHDGYLADDLCNEIERVMQSYLDCDDITPDLELIFVNDGSEDNSLIQLKAALAKHTFVKLVDLSRNFGQHSAIACGLCQARGNTVIRMNVDMQDHPSFIPILLDHYKKTGADLVVGQYDKRNSPLLDKITAALYFRLFRGLTGFEVPKNTSPMRVMSRRFVNAYNSLSEKTRFPQGLDAWLGFEHECVNIEHRSRVDNRSSYNFTKRLSLALSGAVYFSDRPIKFVAGGGLMLSILGFVIGLVIAGTKVLGVDYLPGYASLASIGLIAMGLQLFSIGLIGLYVSKIFVEVKNRPIFIVKEIYTQRQRNNEVI